MKKFLVKIFIFIIGFLAICLVWGIFYFLWYRHYNYINDKNAIYIWGDSQTYYGINIKLLQKELDRNVFTYAQKGAGVYDFLVFTEMVPQEATVLLAVSKPVQIRRKTTDRNTSGIYFPALFSLWQNGYSLGEIKDIINRNIRPPKIVETSVELLEYQDTIVINEWDILRDVYAEVPEYLKAKQSLYKSGIQKLRKKQCNIVFLDYPFHSLVVDSVEKNSPVKEKTEEFVRWIINTSENIRTDTLFLNRDKEVMHDLTHLNELGATQVSQYLAKNILPSLLSSRKNQRKKTKEYYLVIR